jgi:hypothetical protein
MQLPYTFHFPINIFINTLYYPVFKLRSIITQDFKNMQQQKKKKRSRKDTARHKWHYRHKFRNGFAHVPNTQFTQSSVDSRETWQSRNSYQIPYTLLSAYALPTSNVYIFICGGTIHVLSPGYYASCGVNAQLRMRIDLRPGVQYNIYMPIQNFIFEALGNLSKH